MKTLILLLFLFPIVSFSQSNLKNGCASSLKFGEQDSLAHKIAAILSGYEFHSAESEAVKDTQIYTFTNSAGDELHIWFYMFKEGADADLKKPGETKYGLQKLDGQYQDIEKIYTQYFGRIYEAAAAKNAKKDKWVTKCNGKEISVQFRTMSEPGYWEILL